jgi:hypothetical protein
MGKGRVEIPIIGYKTTVACKIKGHYLAFVFFGEYLAPSKDR